MESKNQISFEKFLYVLRRRLIWIILIALVAGIASGLLTKILVKPEYVAYAKFYVNNVSGSQTTMSQSELNVAKSLVDTYIEIFKSDTFLEDVAETSGVDYTPAKIRGEMSASSVGGTEIFKVSISDTNAKRAYLLMSAITEKGPGEIKRVVDCGNVSVVDKPKMPTESTGVGVKRNAVLGVLLGAVISIAVFFIKEIIDVTIYTEEDLTENFKYPVIGTIPNITSGNEKSRRQSKSAKYGGYYGENKTAKEENK